MRGAMLKRRIAKEQKRKKELKDKEEGARRRNINKMNAGLAKAFSQMIAKKEQDDKSSQLIGLRRSTLAGMESKLRAMLSVWRREVDKVRIGRDDGHVWELETPEEERTRLAAENEKARQAMDAAAAAKEKGMDYTITELYKRILKVEKLAEKVKTTTGATGPSIKVSDL